MNRSEDQFVLVLVQRGQPELFDRRSRIGRHQYLESRKSFLFPGSAGRCHASLPGRGA